MESLSALLAQVGVSAGGGSLSSETGQFSPWHAGLELTEPIDIMPQV